MLSEKGNLIKKIKRIRILNEYLIQLEQKINKIISWYMELKRKLTYLKTSKRKRKNKKKKSYLFIEEV